MQQVNTVGLAVSTADQLEAASALRHLPGLLLCLQAAYGALTCDRKVDCSQHAGKESPLLCMTG